MAEFQAVENRNVVVVGKTGAGKSTVANKVLGLEKFPVKNVANSVTSEVEARCSTFYDESSRTRYNFKIIDTLGVFDTKHKNDYVMTKIKTFFQKDSPEGINLVLFVFRKGRFTAEERRTFDYIIGNFSDQISDFSALVLTCCEGQTDAANQEFHASFQREARRIVSFMKKGIYMVGFPDVSKMKPRMKQVIEEEIKEQAEMLRKVVMKADKKCLGKEMFELTFWEKVRQCFIL
ncbi:GTPase IMAP family member 4-like [Acropora muricata]|uniref:GTPase IMAP family member 4-like n=1 Tax=Acropora muricata TaxID=159855 RepID=UPI0034E395F3